MLRLVKVRGTGNSKCYIEKNRFRIFNFEL